MYVPTYISEFTELSDIFYNSMISSGYLRPSIA